MVLIVSCVVTLFVGMHCAMLCLFPDAGAFMLAWISLAIGPIVVASVWYGSRIRYYLIEDNQLVVDRAFFPLRIPLERYNLVHEFRGRVGHVEKIIGNDGLGAIAGHFHSAEHGELRIYASDLEHAIMLEGPREKLIVSPRDSALFVEAVLHHLYTRPDAPTP